MNARMLRVKTIPLIFLGALLFTFLFYQKPSGLNVLVFQMLILGWLIFGQKLKVRHPNILLYGLLWIATAIGVVVANSQLSIFVNWMSLLVFIGVVNYPYARSIFTALHIALHAAWIGQARFMSALSSKIFPETEPRQILWRYRIFIIPLGIIAFFIIIYRQSNPLFDQAIMGIGDFFGSHWTAIFSTINPVILLTFILGIALSNFLLWRVTLPKAEMTDGNTSDHLLESENNENRFGATINEFRAGVFLLILLNIILFFLNTTDIYLVWLNFAWEGQLLKQFVHEGTYLLIFSILVSIGLVLFFFRGDLNWYKNNSILKNLSYFWLAQNAVLVCSVAMRNFHYIDHFALAYKRIGVLLFLLLTLYGLWTVFVKVRKRKSSFYLFRKNGLAIFLVLVLASLVNWDSIIAKYNFKHAQSAFLHLDYLSTLSDKALPYLDQSSSVLSRLDHLQKNQFEFDHAFMTPDDYHQKIQKRKKAFKRRWEGQSFWSWNLPEQIAYHRLFKE